MDHIKKDKFLWKRIQRGDKNALRELFDRHYKPLCSYVLQFTGNLEDAEDIVQNEFIKLWTKRNELHLHTSIKAYLYKCVYNAYLQQTRKETKKDAFLASLKYEAMSQNVFEDDTIFLEKIDKLKGLIEILPDRCREILLLSKRDGYRNHEIAEKLGLSVKTVESQISIAFKKIREGFKENNLYLFLLSKRFGKKISKVKN